MLLELFLAENCFWFYVCNCICGVYFCPCFLLHICVMPFLLFQVIVSSAYWAKPPSVWLCLTFYGPSAQRFLPSASLKHPDGMRRSCDPFRPLNSSVCGTCHFLYARWLWDFESPVSFDETVSFLALGHQGLLCTCHIFVGLLVFRTVCDSLVSFGETVSFLVLGRQLLSPGPSGTWP